MKLHTTQPHPNPLLGRRGDSYNKQAFTLVELIVVITILAILGTIAFVSLQGYSRDSRNSVRITDIKTTETALELYSLQTGKYPLPDNYEVVTTTGSIDLWNKGQFDTELLRKLDRLSDLPKDPKTEDLMGYSTTLQQKEYELKYNLEISNNSNINQTHAISSNSYVKGNYNGLFVVGKNNAYYSTPGLFSEASDVTSTGTFDLHQLQTQHLVSGITNSGTLITTANLENNQKAFAVTLKSQYANNPDLTTGIYEVLANLDVTSTGQLTQFTQAVTSGKASSLIVAANNTETPIPVATYIPGYQVGNSAVFNGSNQYFTHPGMSGGSSDKFTLSAWVKRGKLGVEHGIFGAGTGGGGQVQAKLSFYGDDTIQFYDYTGGSYNFELYTKEKFRDPNKWYHIVASVDLSNVTTADKARLYVDGKRITEFTTSTFAGTSLIAWFQNQTHYAMNLQSASNPYYGYASQVIGIDNQSLEPTAFGEFNSSTGKWQPIAYTGTYGTNGFKLDFSDAGNLGADTSGGADDWNITGVPTSSNDSPSNNYATLNPLDYYSSYTLKDGNRVFYRSGSAPNGYQIGANSTLKVPTTGKWYWEFSLEESTSPQNSTYSSFLYQGKGNTSWESNTSLIGGGLLFSPTLSYTGYKVFSMKKDIGLSSLSSYFGSHLVSDVYMLAYDADTGNMWLGKNGLWPDLGSGVQDPILGVNPGITSIANEEYFIHTACNNAGGPAYPQCGIRYRGNEGDWAYSAPTGFKSLSTANLPTPTILKPNNYFEILTYTGSNSTQNIIGTDWGMNNQFVWIKDRTTNGYEHMLFDSLRGKNNYLQLPAINPAADLPNIINSFNNNGFTIGTASSLVNKVNDQYVAWRWKESPTAGFDIVEWIGNGGGATTMSHNLGKAPEFVLIKSLDNTGTTAWQIWDKDLPTSSHYLAFDSNMTNNGGTNFTGVWTDTDIGLGSWLNTNNERYIAYLWSEIPGFSKIGSYTGNASTDGPFIYTGFKPKYILAKQIDGSGAWGILDTQRGTINPVQKQLYANVTNAEDTGNDIDFLSNGFKIKNSTTWANNAGKKYIFIAFAEEIMK